MHSMSFERCDVCLSCTFYHRFSWSHFSIAPSECHLRQRRRWRRSFGFLAVLHGCATLCPIPAPFCTLLRFVLCPTFRLTVHLNRTNFRFCSWCDRCHCRDDYCSWYLWRAKLVVCNSLATNLNYLICCDDFRLSAWCQPLQIFAWTIASNWWIATLASMQTMSMATHRLQFVVFFCPELVCRRWCLIVMNFPNLVVFSSGLFRRSISDSIDRRLSKTISSTSHCPMRVNRLDFVSAHRRDFQVYCWHACVHAAHHFRQTEFRLTIVATLMRPLRPSSQFYCHRWEQLICSLHFQFRCLLQI